VEAERVGSVRDGSLYGCFSRDETKRRFLIDWISKRERKEEGVCTDHG
jgi:hypothetical protein